jgi:hypothetical protein
MKVTTMWRIRADMSDPGYDLHDCVGKPHIGEIIRRIGTCTCGIGHRTLTGIQNSLKSQFPMMISAISSHLSQSSPEVYHYLTSPS